MRNPPQPTPGVHLQAIKDRFYVRREISLPLSHLSTHAIDQHQLLAKRKALFDPFAARTLGSLVFDRDQPVILFYLFADSLGSDASIATLRNIVERGWFIAKHLPSGKSGR